MKLHKEGKKVIPIAMIVLAIIAALVCLLLRNYLISYVLYAGILFLAGMVFWFFRDPDYPVECDEKSVLSVCDGEVVVIEPAMEREYFKEERIQVSVFMSPVNVHICRVPVLGEIVYQKHKNGKFLPAFVAKSSEENERCTTVIKMNDGTEVLMRQIAGILARKIVAYIKPGAKVTQDQHLGFIRFGSRVDLFLPKDCDIKVKIGDTTKGGKTVIARFK